MPSTSGSERHKLAEDTTTREGNVSNKDEAENIPQGLSEQENEQSFHSQKETSVDKNAKELENLDSEATGHVDTSDNLNTVELDSTTSITQNRNDNGSKAQSDSTKPEISPVAETQAISESETLAAKQDKLVTSHETPDESHKTEESSTTENSKLRSSGKSTVDEKVEALQSQGATIETLIVDENSRTSPMYPNLESIARESGISRTVPGWFKVG